MASEESLATVEQDFAVLDTHTLEPIPEVAGPQEEHHRRKRTAPRALYRDTPSMCSLVQSIVCTWIRDTYGLSLPDYHRLPYVARGFRIPRRQEISSVRQWLRQFEGGHTPVWIADKQILVEYHAAVLTRRFLRAISQLHPPVIIAGGFASARFTESSGTRCGWRGAVSVWTTSTTQAA